MTSEALTRAARAISRADHEAYSQSGHDNMEILDPEGAADCYVAHARAAILAFLSGEDVVEACARAMCDEWYSDTPDVTADDVVLDLRTHPAGKCLRWHGYEDQARASLAALRALVQEAAND